jgi:hypothetical protein
VIFPVKVNAGKSQLESFLRGLDAALPGLPSEKFSHLI